MFRRRTGGFKTRPYHFCFFASFVVKFFRLKAVEGLGIVVKNLLDRGLRDFPLIRPLL